MSEVGAGHLARPCHKKVCIPEVALWFHEAEQHSGTSPVRARVRFGRGEDEAA